MSNPEYPTIRGTKSQQNYHEKKSIDHKRSIDRNEEAQKNPKIERQKFMDQPTVIAREREER